MATDFAFLLYFFFFFSSRRRHTRYIGDWSSDVCSSDLVALLGDLDDHPRLEHARHLVQRVGDLARDGVQEHGRSEERRVGKECRSRWSTCDEKKKEKDETRQWRENIRRITYSSNGPDRT